MQQRRAEWRLSQSQWPVERLVFLDETGLKTNMVRRYGRAPKGRRVVDRTPYGHWKTTTLITALRHDRLDVPTVLDGAMDGGTFYAYVEQQLLPTLRAGDVVVLDNLSCHRTPRVRRLFEAAGVVAAYLPPYSPDLNPIENAYAKLKALARKAAERTVEELWKFAGKVLDEFLPDECLRYLRHCGYNAPLPA